MSSLPDLRTAKKFIPPPRTPPILITDRTSEPERTTTSKLFLSDRANILVTSKLLVKPAHDYDEMMDSLIEEFMQHKTRVSRLMHRRNLHALAGESTSQFLSRIRLVLTYLANKDF